MAKSFIEVRPFNRRIECKKIGVFSSYSYMPRFHYHLEYELFYLDEGSGIFGIEDSVYEISAGDVIFVEPDVKHYFKKTSDFYHYYAFVFDESAFGAESDESRVLINNIKISTKLNFPKDLLKKIEKAVSLEEESSFGSQLAVKTIFYEFFSYIIESHQYIAYSKNLYFQPQVKAVQDTCDFIKQNCHEKIDYSEIIERSNYSKSQFIKIFKQQTGMNITDYINKCRIEMACLDMIKTNKSITEIAIENGFNNIQYFSKKFKEMMDCTPREFKAQAIDLLLPMEK